MQDSHNVICQAASGLGTKLAEELDVSPKRMYELLGPDNPYPKTWRILRPIGRLYPDGLRLIQADFNARCEAILSEAPAHITGATLHKELNDAVHASLAQLPVADQRREITEAMAVLTTRLNELNEVRS